MGDDKGLVVDFVELTVFFIYTVIMALLGFYGLFGFGAFTEQNDLFKYFTYTAPMIFFFLYICVVKVAHKFKKFQNLTGFIHDPEYGLLGMFQPVRNPIILILIAIMIFTTLGFVGSLVASFGQSDLFNFAFPLSIGGEPQQTTEGGKLFYALYTATGENAWGDLILLLIISLGFFTLRKISPDLSTRAIMGILVLPVSFIFAFIWRGVHVLVSGSDQVAQFSHFLFGFTYSFLTFITGSIIPATIYHLSNNFFVKTAQIFGSDVATLFFGLILIVLAGLTFFAVRSKVFRQAEREQDGEQ